MGRISVILRLNMSGHDADGRAEADRYAAPLVMAALIMGRISRIQVRASALLAPLYDPIRPRRRNTCRPILHPLAGGIPVERGWKSLRLFVERVLAPVNAAAIRRP